MRLTSTLSFTALSLLQLSCQGQEVQRYCLPNATRFENRSLVRSSLGTGEEYPLQMLYFFSSVSYLTNKLVSLLISEILGYHMHEVWCTTEGCLFNPEFATGALAGCGWTDCLSDSTRIHIAMNTRSGSHHQYLDSLHDWAVALPAWKNLAARLPRYVGTMGYDLAQGWFLRRSVQEEALTSAGLALDSFRGYNRSWFSPWNYFDRISDINASRLFPCNYSDHRFVNLEMMATYVAVTGDTAGLTAEGTALCHEGTWFLTPACRVDPSTCIPCISTQTSVAENTLLQMMQLGTSSNMPLAIALVHTREWISLIHEHSVIWQALTLDGFHLDLDPVLIQFPTFDKSAWDRGDLRMEMNSGEVGKLVSFDLHQLAPDVEALIKKLDMRREDVVELTLAYQASDRTREATDTLICLWLRENEEIWKRWLPDTSECFSGFGMYDNHLQSFVSSRADRSHLTCYACPSGRFSQVLLDSFGKTHSCEKCPRGTYQNLAATLQCTRCPSGEYQDQEGSVACKRCAQGFYQHLPGSAQCIACDNGTTTLGLGSLSIEDCGCLDGFIETHREDGLPNCLSCQEGLSCPLLSTIDSYETGVSSLGEMHVPSLLPGYTSVRDAALEVLKCGGEDRCPGGTPSTCGSGLFGEVCSECPQNQHWVAGEDGDASCTDCPVWLTMAWVCAAVVLLLALPFSQYEPKVGLGMIKKARPAETLTFTLFSVVDISSNTLQTLSIIGQITVHWPQDLAAFFQWLQIFSLEVTDLGFSCFVGSYGVNQYVAQSGFLPIGLLWICLCFGVWHLCTRKGTLGFFLTTVGQTCRGSFPALCNVALLPLMCYQHPNGWKSNLQYPGILCGSSQHHTMLGLGTSLGVMLVTFLAFCIWATIRLPSWSSNEKLEMLEASRFLLVKYRSDRWWFAIPFLLRGPILSLPLALATDNAVAQIVVIASILMIYVAMESVAAPWKVPVLNLVEITTTWGCILVVLTAGMHVREMSDDMLLFLMIFSMVALAMAGVSVLVTLGMTLWGLFRFAWRGNAEHSFLTLGTIPPADVLSKQLFAIASTLGSVEEQFVIERMKDLAAVDARLIMSCLDRLVLEVMPSKIKVAGFTSGRIGSRSGSIESLLIRPSRSSSSFSPRSNSTGSGDLESGPSGFGPPMSDSLAVDHMARTEHHIDPIMYQQELGISMPSDCDDPQEVSRYF
ncbi:unnamed protein product [Durusdinium trenchii]|uniref:Tyrosine-protein kinase ephrin type A/B receptor-like domain-containing protein n=1 Tax=Durusdinium trenchii TaxID=1381693 RepID=A0ABP0N8H5_9DINO